jgi:hypothetical protein
VSSSPCQPAVCVRCVSWPSSTLSAPPPHPHPPTHTHTHTHTVILPLCRYAVVLRKRIGTSQDARERIDSEGQSRFEVLYQMASGHPPPSCPICYEDVQHRPVLTRCVHMFCRECFYRHAEARHVLNPGGQSSSTTQCPFCRRPVTAKELLEIDTTTITTTTTTTTTATATIQGSNGSASLQTSGVSSSMDEDGAGPAAAGASATQGGAAGAAAAGAGAASVGGAAAVDTPPSYSRASTTEEFQACAMPVGVAPYIVRNTSSLP